MTPFQEVVVADGNRKPKNSWFDCAHPWVMDFVYAPNGNFLLKGDSDEVSDYLHKNFPVCIHRRTYWQKKENRLPFRGFTDKEHRGHWSGKGLWLITFNRCKCPTCMQYHGLIMDRKPDVAAPKANFGITSGKVIGGDDYNPVYNILYYRNLPKRWLPEWSDVAVEYEVLKKAEDHPE